MKKFLAFFSHNVLPLGAAFLAMSLIFVALS